MQSRSSAPQLAALSARPRNSALSITAAALAILVATLYLAIWAKKYGLDLRVYRDSVKFWQAGGNPYLSAFTRSHLDFTYPPFALVALAPLAWTSFAVMQSLLWGASLAAGMFSVVLVARDRGASITPATWWGAAAWTCAAMLVLEPARSGIDYGQVEFILMFAVVVDAVFVPARYRGFVTGVAAAIKLTPLVFLAFYLVRRDVKAVTRLLAAFLACAAAAWIFWPPISHGYWLRDAMHPARIGAITYAGNQSWYAIVHRTPFPPAAATLLWLLLSAVTLTAGVIICWRSSARQQQVPAILAISFAGLLASPVSWSHHWIWVLLIPPALIGSRAHDIVAPPIRFMLWGVCAITVVAPYWWFARGAPADMFDAVLPVWTAATLVAWAVMDLRDWRSNGAASGPVGPDAAHREPADTTGADRPGARWPKPAAPPSPAPGPS